MEIVKAGFYKNWFDIANSITDESERLGFYEIIFNYYFRNEEPAEESSFLLKSLFLAVKANIDADRDRRKGGAPLGNNNAQKQPKTTSCFNVENNLETNKVKVKVKENDKDKEKVKVKVSENYPTTTFSKLDIIHTFAEENGFNFGAKTVKDLEAIATDNLEEFLKNRLEFIKTKYPLKQGDELTKLFIASLKWETKPAKSKKVAEAFSNIKAPTACTYCGAKLQKWSGVPNAFICPTCWSKGERVFWELEGNEYKCSRSS